MRWPRRTRAGETAVTRQRRPSSGGEDVRSEIAPAGKEGAFFDEAVERGPRDAEFKHRCYPKARDLAAFFLFRPEAPTFFFLGALGFRLGGS